VEEARRLLSDAMSTNTCCWPNTFVAMSHSHPDFKHPPHLFKAITHHISQTVGQNTTVIHMDSIEWGMDSIELVMDSILLPDVFIWNEFMEYNSTLIPYYFQGECIWHEFMK